MTDIEWVRNWLENAPTSMADLPYSIVAPDGETLVKARGTMPTPVWNKEAMLAEFYNKFPGVL